MTHEEPHALHAVAKKWQELARVTHPDMSTGAVVIAAAALMAETCRAMAAEGVEPYPQSAPCARCSDEVKTHVALCSSCYAKALPMRLAGDSTAVATARLYGTIERLEALDDAAHESVSIRQVIGWLEGDDNA